MITEIDAKLLEKIADLTGKPAGAFNIRKDMGCEARQSTEHIAIDPRADGKPGIDIHFKAGTKGETCHIPVIISQTGMSDMVYNDFYVADDCDVNIVAGCGIHNSGCDESRHDGIHTFHIGRNCRVHYTEKHYGEDAQGETGKNVMNPQTIVYLGENSTMQMDTVQIRGIDSTLRDTRFYCEAGLTCALLIWLTLIALLDVALLGFLIKLQVPENIIYAAALLNPVQVFKIAALSLFDPVLTVLGPASYFILDLFGNTLLIVTALLYLTGAGLLFLCLGYRRFTRRDLL